MPKILGLFALFSIGSAAAIACDTAGGFCTDVNDNIGHCLESDSTCNIDTDAVCKTKSTDETCGRGNLTGKCDASSTKKCRFPKKIKVDYTLQVTTGDDLDIEEHLKTSEFKSALQTAFGRDINTVYPACDPDGTPALPSNTTSVTCPIPQEFFGVKCSLVCNSGYSQSKEHGTMCGASSKWTTADGECAKACPKEIDGGVNRAGGTSGTAIEGSLVDGKLDTIEINLGNNGVLTCNIFSGDQCTHKCKNTSQKSTGTTLQCTTGVSTYVWKGDVGACAASSDKLSATVEVALNTGDNHDQIVAATSDERTAFENEFKLKIAQAIAGISPENVVVAGIRVVDASRRRLTAGDAGKRSVLVDYTILRAPEGGADLVPPRVLRGIL